MDAQTENATLKLALAAKDAENAKLQHQVEELTKQVEALTERLGRNSSNSNQPPSSDRPGATSRKKRRKKAKGKSKRKQGGQPGHRGANRGLVPAEQVDDVKDLYPNACENCWATLEEAPDANAKRHQSIEVLPLKPHTTEYRRHSVKCGQCGHKTQAAYDENVIPSSPFGPRLMSIIAMLTGAYHVSRRKTSKLMSDLLGVKISLGAVSAVEGRVSEALKPVVKEVDAQIERATVKHTDGTRWLRRHLAVALWTIAAKMATTYKIVRTGSKVLLEPLFGSLKGILVSDRATALNFWVMERRQICWAHLLRRFVWFSERAGPAGRIGHALLDYTAIMFNYWHAYKDGQLDGETFRARMKPLQRQVEALLAKAVNANIKGVSGSCADILKHEAALWTFVDHDDVEPTNNHAEHELREFVIWRKCSFGSQSERGDRFAERIMTVAKTARKQGKPLLPFLTASCVAWQTGTEAPSLFAADIAGAA